MEVTAIVEVMVTEGTRMAVPGQSTEFSLLNRQGHLHFTENSRHRAPEESGICQSRSASLS